MQNFKAVQFKHLFYLYLIIPFSFLIISLDQLFSLDIKSMLPKRPEEWSFWIYVFGMPHVFASYLLLADENYLNQYRDKLINTAIIVLISPLLLTLFFGFSAVFFVFTAMIVYHTVAQQFGLALIAAKTKPDWMTKINTFVGAGIGVVIYSIMYGDAVPVLQQYSEQLLIIAYILLFPFVLFSLRQIFISRTTAGKTFIALNVLLVFSLFYSFILGWFVLVILIGRIIHEMSAWIIYGVHDHNRNQLEKHNLVYRHLPIPPIYAGIIVAFVVGIAITYLSESNQHFLSMLIVSLSLYHYLIEGFIWKGNTGPKQALCFK